MTSMFHPRRLQDIIDHYGAPNSETVHKIVAEAVGVLLDGEALQFSHAARVKRVLTNKDYSLEPEDSLKLRGHNPVGVTRESLMKLCPHHDKDDKPVYHGDVMYDVYGRACTIVCIPISTVTDDVIWYAIPHESPQSIMFLRGFVGNLTGRINMTIERKNDVPRG